MKPGEKIRVEGVRKLDTALRKAGEEDARQMLKAANKEAAEIVEGAARPRIAVKTGRLAATLKSSGSYRGGAVQLGKLKVPWAAAYLFGSKYKNRKPHPVLFDALDSKRVVIQETYEKRIEELLEKLSNATDSV